MACLNFCESIRCIGGTITKEASIGGISDANSGMSVTCAGHAEYIPAAYIKTPVRADLIETTTTYAIIPSNECPCAQPCNGSTGTPCKTCFDGIQNQGGRGVDCEGPCGTVCPTCSDEIKNGDEEGVDCGSADCEACPTCFDGILNQGEDGIDCNGPCDKDCCTDGHDFAGGISWDKYTSTYCYAYADGAKQQTLAASKEACAANDACNCVTCNRHTNACTTRVGDTPTSAGAEDSFVQNGTPFTCIPRPCDASAVPANGYHAEYNTLLAGRYIYIQNVPGEYIHLTEVEAFDGAGTVIDATVAEMSTVGWGGVPGNCIDGNLGEPVCHTQGGASEWLKIDYGEETTIASIVVHNRPNNKNRIDGAKISITNDDGVALWSSTIEGSHATYTFAGPAVCSSSIPSGSSCAPSCNEGHVAVGERSCFAGVMTDTFICTPTDCECKNGGIQSGSMAGGDCSCDCANVAGFEGDTCEDPKMCNSGCENGGTPSGSVAGGDCGCDCSTAPGFVGPTCSDANSDCEELCSPSGMRMRGFRKLKP